MNQIIKDMLSKLNALPIGDIAATENSTGASMFCNYDTQVAVSVSKNSTLLTAMFAMHSFTRNMKTLKNHYPQYEIDIAENEDNVGADKTRGCIELLDAFPNASYFVTSRVSGEFEDFTGEMISVTAVLPDGTSLSVTTYNIDRPLTQDLMNKMLLGRLFKEPLVPAE